MKKLSLAILALVAVSNNAFAWKETGGGDEVALEFRNAFATALRAVKEGKITGRFSAEDLERAAEKASVIVVDEKITVRFRDLTQESVAVNKPAEGLIKINRDRWNRLKNAKIQEAVALHEVLSLIGVERTGYYEVSAKYLEKQGLSGWLVSGMGNRVERPAPKTLYCEFDLIPAGGGYDRTETIRFTEAVKEFGPGEPWAFAALKNVTTKDGRFEFSVMAVQPFRTAQNPAAYEYVSISLNDKKLLTSTGAGPNFPAQLEGNASQAFLSQMLGSPLYPFDMISGFCSLK